MRVLMMTLALALVGCAAPPQKPRAQAVVTTKPPVCEGVRQCERLWIEAQDAIVTVTGMRVRLVTESRIETFAPTRISTLGGVVTKYPMADDKYEIRVRLECYRNSDCGLIASGTDMFNTLLAGYNPK